MILKIEQQRKELFSADFTIWHLEKKVGSISVQGKLGSMEAEITIHLFDKDYYMVYAGGFLKERPLPDKSKAYRPYKIFNSEHRILGNIAQIDQREGWFTTISYMHMYIVDQEQYDLYPIGFGAEGGKHPVYCGNKQIAQIDKPCEIYNDLHHYTIYAVDQDAAEISALFAAYMYINASFEPGQKVKQSYTKCTSITLNKTPKQKYNPDFKETIQP